MTGSRPAMVLAIGLLAMLLGGAMQAQDLSAGLTPAQLFHTNCSTCHKSPRGLAAAGVKQGRFSGLEGFLAEHYTAEPRSAGVLAAYLKSVGGAAQARHHRTAAKSAKPAGKTDAAKGSDKPDKMKAGEGKLDKPRSAKPKADTPSKLTDEKSGKPAGIKQAAKPSEAKRERPKVTQKKTD